MNSAIRNRNIYIRQENTFRKLETKESKDIVQTLFVSFGFDQAARQDCFDF